MKKLLAVLICISMIACIFAACSAKSDEDETQSSVSSTSTITTDDAKITESDAIRLIESYSDKELGITAEDRDKCSFMVKGSGIQIEKDYYVQVVAAVKTAHEEGEETSYTFDHKGEYYIRYDGKQILSLDLETGEYSEMKVKEVPTTEAPVTHAETDAE